MSKMQRLDYLIGRDHWLSVGNYKEELLRSLIKNLLPKRYEVSTGFILSLNENGEQLKSKQQDIIIWDSNDFSAIFRDGDFVILPPEACRAVIEVKSTLTRETLKKALSSSDDLHKFMKTPSLSQFKISKYIFSFGSGLNFPVGYFKSLCDFYDNDVDGQLSVSKRQECTRQFWPSTEKGENFTIDGIFSLNDGAILRDIAIDSNKTIRFIFKSFNLISDEVNHVYTFFEHIIHSDINAPNGRRGFYYSKQPGLFSLMSELSLETPEKGTMVYPYSDSVRSVKITDLYLGNSDDI